MKLKLEYGVFDAETFVREAGIYRISHIARGHSQNYEIPFISRITFEVFISKHKFGIELSDEGITTVDCIGFLGSIVSYTERIK